MGVVIVFQVRGVIKMEMPSSVFRWFLPEFGFAWAEEEADYFLRPQAVWASQISRHRSFPGSMMTPLLADSSLFRHFADTDLTLEKILSFANRHGALSTEGASPLIATAKTKKELVDSYCGGERYHWWRAEIQAMRGAVGLWDAIQARDESYLAEHLQWLEGEDGSGVYFVSHPSVDLDRRNALTADNSEEVTVQAIATDKVLADQLDQLAQGDLVGPGLVYLKMLIERKIKDKLSIETTPDFGHKKLHFEVLPTDLLSGMWLQFVRSIASDLKYRACKVCESWFLLSPEVARTSRHFCSNACKSRDYRNKQEKARQGFAKGKSFKLIAKELRSTVPTVRRWITGRAK